MATSRTQLVMNWQMVTCHMQRPNPHQLQKAQTWIQLDVHTGHPVFFAFTGVHDKSSRFMFKFPERTLELVDMPHTS